MPDSLTIHIPMLLERHGARKLIIAPAHTPRAKPKPDMTMINAIVRAHRWRREIEGEERHSIAQLADRDGITRSYVCRILKLTSLSPALVSAILDGTQPRTLKLADLFKDPPFDWQEQEDRWLGSSVVDIGISSS